MPMRIADRFGGGATPETGALRPAGQCASRGDCAPSSLDWVTQIRRSY